MISDVSTWGSNYGVGHIESAQSGGTNPQLLSHSLWTPVETAVSITVESALLSLGVDDAAAYFLSWLWPLSPWDLPFSQRLYLSSPLPLIPASSFLIPRRQCLLISACALELIKRICSWRSFGVEGPDWYRCPFVICAGSFWLFNGPTLQRPA